MLSRFNKKKKKDHQYQPNYLALHSPLIPLPYSPKKAMIGKATSKA